MGIYVPGRFACIALAGFDLVTGRNRVGSVDLVTGGTGRVHAYLDKLPQYREEEEQIASA
jgi:hypothetical protein